GAAGGAAPRRAPLDHAHRACDRRQHRPDLRLGTDDHPARSLRLPDPQPRRPGRPGTAAPVRDRRSPARALRAARGRPARLPRVRGRAGRAGAEDPGVQRGPGVTGATCDPEVGEVTANLDGRVLEPLASPAGPAPRYCVTPEATFRGNDLDAAVAGVAAALADRGVVPGQRVMLAGSNTPDLLLTMLALMHLDASVVLFGERQPPESYR